MILTLFNNNSIKTYTLPSKVSGQYWLYDNIDVGNKIISVEGVDGKWYLKSNSKSFFADNDGHTIKRKELEENKFYIINYRNSNEKSYILTENITKNRSCYQKLAVSSNCRITIGRDSTNCLAFANKYVSSKHSAISFNSGVWSVEDLNSTNGTFVNGIKLNASSKLNPGDIVFVMGLKIIVGSNFFAFNNPDGLVAFDSERFTEIQSQHVTEDSDDYELGEPDYFYRSPRFKRDIENIVFKIDSPPANQIGDEMPLMMAVGPSMTMGMASLVTAIFTIVNNTGSLSSSIPTLAMSFSMLIGCVLWPIITKKYDKKKRRKKEALRQKKYVEYLHNKAEEISNECKNQESILNANYITIEECVNRINSVDRTLWERGYSQNDFLTVRLGKGNLPMKATMQYTERHFTLEDDNLQEELLNLCESKKELKNVPITVSLFKNKVTGIIGQVNEIKNFAKGIIIQLSAMYSYDEVKFIFIYDENDESSFEFVKWLPHVWTDEKTFRFIASNANEVKEISSYLDQEVDIRAKVSDNDKNTMTPYYVIFSFSKNLAVHSELIKKVLASEKHLNISVVTAYEELKDLPKECSTIIELLRNNTGKLYDKDDISNNQIAFTPDINLMVNPLKLSVKLANVFLDLKDNAFNLPSKLTFLEMYGVGNVFHLNALSRWKENDPTKSLEVPVGVDTMGELFRLDLHEKFHGPHGLVAGMTGSGKSEFIITYILSLAVNFHPYEVAFILIDYKGGGMAKSFENLPHTIGIITNLDGPAIRRSLISIESELKRRQAIFAETSKKLGISNIDIYKYQRLFRDGQVKEPLQHLFIISDEFAELKTQKPEFMAQLISAARIGRSLGVHLILATQKPSGVVDDQIWSNSKFRICLKVQEKSDSMDMLKRPDAAELSETGRFYLQVGYNELFELGQSAWSGAPYYPSDQVVKDKDNGVSIIDRNGHIVKHMNFDNPNKGTNSQKQLDAVTAYLKKIADEEKIKVKPLWLEPIPSVLILPDMAERFRGKIEKFVLNPLIGAYDDPVRQAQHYMTLPITEEGNTVVYGSTGSGKTSFINAVIYSLITLHTSDEVNLYILDFASETLRAFSSAPHIGDVILSYESEKIDNLFRMIMKELSERKKLFVNYGGDYKSYVENGGSDKPNIVIIINNYASFNELYEEKEEIISYIAREGIKYGVYLILTATSTSSVRYKMLQNFKQQIVLQMNDESEYSTVLGKTDGLYPARYKGRGLMKTDMIYEFQTAMLTGDANPFKFIKEKCDEINATSYSRPAERIPILPKIVNGEYLSGCYDTNDQLVIPIGVEKSTMNVSVLDLKKVYINFFLSNSGEYVEFTDSILKMMSEDLHLNVTIFDYSMTLSTRAISNIEEINNKIDLLFDECARRNNSYKDAVTASAQPENFEPLVIAISDVEALFDELDKEYADKLTLILEKGSTNYNMHIILANSVKSLSSMTFTKWFKTNASDSNGVWIGDGIDDQYQLKFSNNNAGEKDDVEKGFGFVVTDGNAVKVKLSKEFWEDE